MRVIRTTHLLPLLLGALPAARGASVDSVAAPTVDSATAPREVVLEGREVVERLSPPSGGTRWSREDLSLSADLVEALGRAPGVMVRSSGGLGGFATLSLRGSPSEQVEVLLDGVPLGGSAGSSVDLGPMPLDGLERAEILHAGSEGSGGVPRLELVSRKGWARTGGAIRAGSFGERAVSGWWGDGTGATSVAAWWERSDNDYPFPWDNGTRYNTSDDGIRRLSNNDYSGWGAAASWRPDPRWEGSLRLDGSDRGLSSPLLADPRGRWDRQALQASARWTDEADWRQVGEFSWRRAWSHWDDPSRSTGYQASSASRERGDDANLSWSAARRSGAWWDPRISASGRWERSERRSVGAIDVPQTPDGSRATAGASVGWTGQKDQSFGADLFGRGDLLRDQRDFSMSISGAADAPDTVLWRRSLRGQARLWAAQGAVSEWVSATFRERPPDFSEWMGDNGSGLAKPGLKAERSNSFEVGARTRREGLGLDLAAWYSIYRDPIQSELAGSSPLVVHVNGAGYEAAGLDGVARARWRILSGSVSGTVQKGRVRDPNPSLAGNEPRRTPRWKGSAQVSAAPGLGFSAGYTLDAQGATWATDLNAPDDRRPGRTLHGTWIRWNRGGIAAVVAIRNITDVHTEDLEDLPLSGRQYQARLEFDFATAKSGSGGAEQGPSTRTENTP